MRTRPLNVSYARQDCTPGLVILPVILYIRLPWFLMHSVLGEMLAMPSKTGSSFALTLCTHIAYPGAFVQYLALVATCEDRSVVRIGRW